MWTQLDTVMVKSMQPPVDISGADVLCELRDAVGENDQTLQEMRDLSSLPEDTLIMKREKHLQGRLGVQLEDSNSSGSELEDACEIKNLKRLIRETHLRATTKAAKAPGVAAPEKVVVPQSSRASSASTSTAWGLPGWEIAILRRHGEQIGWAASCRCHHDATDTNDNVCGKQLTYGIGANALTDAEIIRRLKQWLLKGVAIERGDPTGRTKHVKSVATKDPRKFQDMPDAELDDWLLSVM